MLLPFAAPLADPLIPKEKEPSASPAAEPSAEPSPALFPVLFIEAFELLLLPKKGVPHPKAAVDIINNDDAAINCNVFIVNAYKVKTETI